VPQFGLQEDNMGCGNSSAKPEAAPAAAKTTQAPTQAPASATKEPADGKPRPGDTVTVSGKEAKVLETTTTDVKLKFVFSGEEKWVDAEEVMVIKGKLPLAEVKSGVQVTTVEGVKGKVLRRTTTDIYLQTDGGKEIPVPFEDITVVKVYIEKATNLANMDYIGKSDPYVTCQLADKPQSMVKTPMVANDLNPQWNFEAVLLGYTTGDALVFDIWDKDMMKDDYLGRCTLEHMKFHEAEFVGDLPLLNRKGEPAQGSLRIRAKAGGAPPLQNKLKEVNEPSQGGPLPMETDDKKVDGGVWCC
jgi:hypothetical protein